MALTVGTDTYISVADAKTYASANHLSTDAKLIAWTALSDTDKEIVLRRAMQIIENLPIVGVKSVTTQALQFPRVIYTEVDGQYEYGFAYSAYSHSYIQTSVPACVGQAQTEIAMQFAVGVSKRLTLQRQGVTQYSIGGLSETFSKSSLLSILSEEAQMLLNPFLATSTGVC